MDHIEKHFDHYPPMERKKEWRPVELEETKAYTQGLKVALVPDPKQRRAQYVNLVLLELDLVVKLELGPVPINAIALGRLFMPRDFVAAFGPKTRK